MIIPKQLCREEFRFVLLGKWDNLKTLANGNKVSKGKIPFESEWQKNGYKFNDTKILNHLNNVGAIGGPGRLRVLDIDDLNLVAEFDKKINTYTVKTGSGGRHYYFTSDYDTNHAFDAGELRSNNYQVVSAPSKHPNGILYKVVNNMPVQEISEPELLILIKPLMKTNNKISNKSINEYAGLVKGFRSEVDYADVEKYCALGLTDAEIDEKMKDIPKWKEGGLAYQNTTIKNARLSIIKSPKIEIMDKFSPVPYAKQLMDHTSFKYDMNKQFWRYDNKEGIWKPDAEQYIHTYLRKIIMGENQQKKYFITEITAYLKDMNYDGDFEFNKNPYNIAFKNIVFDLKKDDWINFAPELHLTNKLDIDIDETITECPIIDKFFADCLDEEHKPILYDTGAYTLFEGTPYQKVFFVFGPAATGKSLFLCLLQTFLGKKNTSMIEPRKMQDDKHAGYKMWLKKANIVSDIDYDAFENINQLKKISGGDSMDIRPMHNVGWSEILYAKQIYSTNKLPIVREKTNAWYRRVYLINFKNIISRNKKDKHLFEKMITEKELQGFAYKCLQHLRAMYKRKFDFMFDIDEDKMPSIYEEQSNPIKLFIRENCVNEYDNWIEIWEFKKMLDDWLKVNHFPPQKEVELNQYMEAIYSKVKRQAKKYGEEDTSMRRCWKGIRWKTLQEKNQKTLDTFDINHIYIKEGEKRETNNKKEFTAILQEPVLNIEVDSRLDNSWNAFQKHGSSGQKKPKGVLAARMITLSEELGRRLYDSEIKELYNEIGDDL